jgi:hypothetical protein
MQVELRAMGTMTYVARSHPKMDDRLANGTSRGAAAHSTQVSLLARPAMQIACFATDIRKTAPRMNATFGAGPFHVVAGSTAHSHS